MCRTYVFYSTICGNPSSVADRHVITTFPEECDDAKSGQRCRRKEKKVLSEKCCCSYYECCRVLERQSVDSRGEAYHNWEEFDSCLKAADDLHGDGLTIADARKRTSADKEKLARLWRAYEDWEKTHAAHGNCAKKRGALSPEEFDNYPEMHWTYAKDNDPELYENRNKNAGPNATPQATSSRMDLDDPHGHEGQQAARKPDAKQKATGSEKHSDSPQLRENPKKHTQANEKSHVKQKATISTKNLANPHLRENREAKADSQVRRR